MTVQLLPDLSLVIHILRSYVCVRFWPNKWDCIGTILTAVCIVLFLMVKRLCECLGKHIRQFLLINSFSVPSCPGIEI